MPKDRGKPWERLPNETPKAYEAFSVYRDLGTDRSLAETAQRLGKSRELMHRWSKLYDWFARAREWDIEVDRKALAKIQKDRVEVRARQIKIAQTLQSTGLKALQELVIDRPDVALRFILEGARLEDLQLAMQEAEQARKIAEAQKSDEDAEDNGDIVLVDLIRNNGTQEEAEDAEDGSDEFKR